MPPQQHIIMKQVMDLAVDEQLDARDIQEHVTRLCHERIIPLIENYLDRLDIPGYTTQIPFIEIDLGVINVAALDELFEERFEQQLAAYVKETVGSNPDYINSDGAAIVPNEQTDKVLVACFLETGTFPWWVKDGSPKLFMKALNHVIDAEKHDRVRLLRALFEEKAAIRRLVYNADEKLLQKVALAATANNTDVKKAIEYRNLKRVYQIYKEALTLTAFQETWWTDFFTLTLQQTWAKGRKTPRLIFLLLDPVAGYAAQHTKSTEPKVLLSNYFEQYWALNLLLKVFCPGFKLKQVIKEDILSLQSYFNEARELFGLDKVADQNKAMFDMGRSEADKVANENVSSGNSDARLDDSDRRAGEKVTSSNSDIGLNNNNQPAGENDSSGNLLVAPVHNNQPVTGNMEAMQDGSSKDQNLRGSIPGREGALHGDNAEHPEDIFRNSVFSHIEKLYIQNSGLALLWPFLPRLFSNLALIADDRFVNVDAAAKACVLMQYLVQGDAMDRFEPAMPLNKLLSGLDIFGPVNLQATLTDNDCAAADELLQAVIGHVPLWKDLSIDNLRRAYLQREGILSTRDAQWLLQVKRETYDIILDKLPWGVSMIKFPWMESLIFVEWIST